MKGRSPTADDYRRMQIALMLVTAYDMSVEDGDFSLFMELMQENTTPMTLQSMIQFSWLLLEAMEQHGFDKAQVMAEHGINLATTAEKLEK